MKKKTKSYKNRINLGLAHPNICLGIRKINNDSTMTLPRAVLMILL